MLRALVLVAALAPLALACQAQQLFRWVDDKGQVHFSDSPPPSSAKGVSRQTVTTAPASPSRPAGAPAAPSVPAHPPSSAETPHAQGPSTTASNPSDSAERQDEPPTRISPEECRAWRLEYRRSQRCFAPYRNATGGIKAEAFAVCGREVLDPSPYCGLPSYSSGGNRR